MRYITEQELREAFAGGVPDRYAVPAGVKLTPAARQYLTDLRLYCAGGAAPEPIPEGASSRQGKPEHMTHLTAGQLVPKTHPRIALRGKLDTLEAEILVLQATATQRGARALVGALEDALSLTRRVLGCEVTGEPLTGWALGGMSPEAVRKASHDPQALGFAGHVVPVCTQGLTAALLNRLRAVSREAELLANAAFCSQSGCSRTDLLLALNRLSSYFYVLQLQTIRQGGDNAWIEP